LKYLLVATICHSNHYNIVPISTRLKDGLAGSFLVCRIKLQTNLNPSYQRILNVILEGYTPQVVASLRSSRDGVFWIFFLIVLFKILFCITMLHFWIKANCHGVTKRFFGYHTKGGYLCPFRNANYFTFVFVLAASRLFSSSPFMMLVGYALSWTTLCR